MKKNIKKKKIKKVRDYINLLLNAFKEDKEEIVLILEKNKDGDSKKAKMSFTGIKEWGSEDVSIAFENFRFRKFQGSSRFECMNNVNSVEEAEKLVEVMKLLNKKRLVNKSMLPSF